MQEHEPGGFRSRMVAHLGRRPGRRAREKRADVAILAVVVARCRDIRAGGGRNGMMMVVTTPVMGVSATGTRVECLGRLDHLRRRRVPVSEEVVGRGGQHDRQHGHQARQIGDTATP